MIASEAIIYSVLKNRNIKLIKPELLKYFKNDHKHIYNTILSLSLHKKAVDIDAVKNSITDNFKDITASGILSLLQIILSKPGYGAVIDHEKRLKIEYCTGIYTDTLNKLSNTTSTIEMKNNVILSAAENLKMISQVNDLKYHENIIREIVERKARGEIDDIQRNSIKINDVSLSEIFGDTIYPFPYSITAQPNNYKTSVLLNLINEFDKLNKKVLLITFEDTSHMAAIKLQSIRSSISKSDIISGNYSVREMEQYIKDGNGNIAYWDKLRTADELYCDLSSYLKSYEVDMVAVDFLQAGKKEKRQTDFEMISAIDDNLRELGKEYHICTFRLNQPTKDRMNVKNILGMGDEKGSGNIAQNSRFALSINDCTGSSPNSGVKIISVYKTSFSKKGVYKVEFNPVTGRLLNVSELNYND